MSDPQPSTAASSGVDFDAVALALEPGGRLVRAEPLTGGSSATIVRLDVELPSGLQRSMVFRQLRSPEFKGNQASVARKEFELLRLLSQQQFEVAEPLLLDESSPDPYLVTEWIAGSTVVSESGVSNAVDQMAGFLARLHTVESGDLDVAGLDAIEDPAVGALRCLPDNELGDAARRALGSVKFGSGNPDSLLHGDYWPGNVLWQDGQLVAVIDWEDACIGDPLVDLACARVELLCQFGTEAAEDFTRTYLELAPSLQAVDLPVWEVYVSSSALASMRGWGLAPEAEAVRRSLTEQFLADAIERLEVAGRS